MEQALAPPHRTRPLHGACPSPTPSHPPPAWKKSPSPTSSHAPPTSTTFISPTPSIPADHPHLACTGCALVDQHSHRRVSVHVEPVGANDITSAVRVGDEDDVSRLEHVVGILSLERGENRVPEAEVPVAEVAGCESVGRHGAGRRHSLWGGLDSAGALCMHTQQRCSHPPAGNSPPPLFRMSMTMRVAPAWRAAVSASLHAAAVCVLNVPTRTYASRPSTPCGPTLAATCEWSEQHVYECRRVSESGWSEAAWKQE
eukprot:365153-Chlamydomonas_euryale.AAC.3